MPEEQTPTMDIGGQKFNVGSVDIKHRHRVDDPDKPGKKKTVEKLEPIIAPLYGDVKAAATLFYALVTGAEQLEAGNGLKLANALLMPRFEDAFHAGWNADTSTHDQKAYDAVLYSPERPRSSGQSIGEMNEELAELSLEFLVLSQAANTPSGWQEVKLPDGSQQFDAQPKFFLRLSEVKLRIRSLSELRLAKALRNEQAQAKRAAKTKAAATVAAALPPVTTVV